MDRELRVSKSGRRYYNYYKRIKVRTLKGTREKVWARDKSECQDCHKSGIKLCIHHINGSDYITKPNAHNGEAEHNNINNLILLCSSCHQKRHESHQIALGRQLEVKRMRKRGFTFQEIGNCLGVSKQRAHILYHYETKTKRRLERKNHA